MSKGLTCTVAAFRQEVQSMCWARTAVDQSSWSTLCCTADKLCIREQLRFSVLLYMEYEDVRCTAIWLFQWLALGLSIPGLLFGWAVIAWSCFLFLVGALVLSGISQVFSLCSHCAIKQSK